MLGVSGQFGKDCQPREQRAICHQSFWCGEDRTHAINRSEGGMCFRMSRRAQPGEIVTLHHGPALEVKARIAWTRRLSSCTEVGVQFADSAENVKQWVDFLTSGADSPKTDSEGQPILALPAPGQTYKPVFNAARLQVNMSSAVRTGSVRFGKSWSAAQQIMGPGQMNGNSFQQ